MAAPPPDDPQEPEGPSDPRRLDFDAEFDRIVADWTPSGPGEPPRSVERAAPVEPPLPVEPVETTPPTDAGLRDLFRQAWGDDDEAPAPRDTDEHFVPPPAPPVPRPEPPRLLAWAGLVAAPVLALLWLLVGSLPSWASFLFFCWFVGGFGYLVATMNDEGRDGWDDGAQV